MIRIKKNKKKYPDGLVPRFLTDFPGGSLKSVPKLRLLEPYIPITYSKVILCKISLYTPNLQPILYPIIERN